MSSLVLQSSVAGEERAVFCLFFVVVFFCLVCLVIVVWLFLAVPWGCLQFVIVVFLDHTHLLFSV